MKKANFIFIALLSVGCSNASPVENSIILEENKTNTQQEPVEKTTAESDSIIKEPTELTSEIIKIEETVKSTEIIPTKEIEVVDVITEIQADGFHDYIQWSTFLSQHVSSTGKVNYTKIKADKAQLNAIIQKFEKNYPNSSWSSKQQLAYWINAYNLYTLQFVSDHYPISSITKITAKPWDKKFIKLGGETLSLNDIEHKKIRAKNNEPRIHFALNCASESCPILYNKAFTAKNLSYQLTKQTKRFLNDKSKNDFSDPNNIKISSLFDWYKGDFVKKEGSVISFINKYRTEQLVDPTISYLEYLWGIND